MDLHFKKLAIQSKDELEPYINIRPIDICEYNFNLLYLWNDYYQIRYCVRDNYVLLLGQYKDQTYAMMPLGAKTCFKQAFEELIYCFNKIQKPFELYVADQVFADFIQTNYSNHYDVYSDRDSFDYLYNGDDLRHFKGKRFHKKRNHINSFLKEYEGKFEYKSLSQHNYNDIAVFLHEWNKNQEQQEELDYELNGIKNIIQYKEGLNVKIGGIFIEGKLEAMSLGSYHNPVKNTAIIHVEKANVEIRGLYPMICQQFLINEFPHVDFVNREEDMGKEGLRKSKLSYRPIQLLEKFTILEKS